MDFKILGPVEAIEGDRPLALGGARQRALLAMLLLHANEVVSSDRLIDELWAQDGREEAGKSLQMAVSRLRKALDAGPSAGTEGGVILTRRPGYELRVDPQRLDVTRFEVLVDEGRRALAAADAQAARRHLDAALGLWRGPPLADLAYESFAQAEIARLEELRLGALEQRVQADLALGRHDQVVGELEALVSEHPFRERLRGQLMLALYRSDRQADALQAYQDARRTLVDELGIEPGEWLRELERGILAQDPGLQLVVDGPPAAEPAGTAARTAFVGRDSELAELVAGLDDAFAGRGRLVLLVGEPGIGKSRLAEELIAHARGRGARVLVGRCWEAGGAPAYWPWVQSLRTYVRDAPPDALTHELGVGAADLAEVLPDLRRRLPDLPQPASPASEGARFRLFEAATSLLLSATRDRPLVVVLDDLHAADEPSLLLLRFVAREIAASRLLMVCAYRDVDPALRDPLSSALAELIREPHTVQIPLAGLTERDVAEYVELSTGIEPAAWLVRAIHAETEGNPLFMAEVVRLLAGEGDVAEHDAHLRIPAGVRAVIGRRVGRLSEPCRDLLVSASAMGREFGLDALAQLSGLSAKDLLDVLDEAMAERVLSDVPGSPGRLRFGHALIRDTLYEELTPARRIRLHHEVAAALEAVYAADLEPHLAELAQHYFAAAPAGVGERAVEYAWRAGDRAASQLAHEEAVRLYRMAIEVLPIGGRADEPARCELLLALGEAQARGGDTTAAQEALLAAADIARRLNLPEQFGRAALGFEGRFVWPRATDERTIPLLEEARRLLEGDSALRVGVLARLCGAMRAEPWRHQERAAFGKEAVASARRLGDPATIAYALEGRWAVLFDAVPEKPEERLAVATEMAERGHEAGDKERAWSGHLAQVILHVEQGDRRAADAALDRALELAEALRQPAQLQMTLGTRALFALLDGRLETAEALIEESVTLGEQAWMGSLLNARVELWMLRRHQGRVAEVREAMESCVVEFPERGALCRSILAHLNAELGELAEARRLFDELAADRFANLPATTDRFVNLGLLSEVAAILNDADRAEILYELLLPGAACNAVDVPEIITGAVARNLGILAALMGRWAEAERHFEAALQLNERFGARVWVAYTELDFARMLISRDKAGDRERSLDLLRTARGRFEQLGMDSWAATCG
jgi:DNA-binding SARP family transcriptional activator/predicted ATPase